MAKFKKVYSFSKVPIKDGTILEKSTNIKSCYKGFSERQLFKNKIIDNYLGKNSGLFITLPKGQKILNAIINILKDEVAKKQEFEEYSFPKLIDSRICNQAKIMGKWDDYLLAVKSYGKTNGINQMMLLDPLQCTPFYSYLENKKFTDKDLPLKAFDVSGPTYRNEDKAELNPMVKQLEFRRMEFVYFGFENDVIKLRENILRRIEFISSKLSMPFRRVIGTGCYEVTSSLIRYPDKMETIPIIDLEMKLTKSVYRRKEKISFLEVAGASVLRDQQTSRFKITNHTKSIWSGCVGIGLNRLMYAFLSNNGFNEKKWPKLMRQYIKKQ